MNRAQEEDLVLKLRRLSFKLAFEITARLSRGTLRPQGEPYFHWEITDFKYGDKGVERRASGRYAEQSTGLHKAFG